MKTFNCPDCLIQENTYNPADLCQSCIRNQKPTYVIKPYTNDDPCESCPNNTKNGGSGHCNCTIPYFHGKNIITY